jgi:hypothetical protein
MTMVRRAYDQLLHYSKQTQGGPINMNASARFSNGRQTSSSPLGRRGGASSRRTEVDFDELPSPRPRKSLVSSMRRNSMDSTLHTSYVHLDLPDDDPFDVDNDVENIEIDAEMEDSGSRSKTSRQQATARRANTTNAVQSESDDDDDNVPRAQSKGKARMETQDEDDVVEEEISRGLSDVEMQQDEDEEVVESPPKKPPKEKKPRKKRVLAEVPCKSTPTYMRIIQPYSLQYLLKTRLASEGASDFATNHSSGGGARK